MGLSGILLAAGAGSRYGTPKALVPGWLERGVAVLTDAGCDPVVVVLGAEAEVARKLLPDDPRVRVVVAADWAAGLSASLRAGLAAATGDAALVTLVDLPEMPATVTRRLARDADSWSLRQAAYRGSPGHPVLLGAQHWKPLASNVDGDRGARPYLVRHGADEIECGDLWHGRDVDRPEV
ncbi:nucleotidyltransferase family protein [Herbiconiux sp. SYSU D00978]|uniref:nucleotidyltransferase family protein n=1 Tax=Herbiconiux sp. SYSU D00978 TaxID=2812562 RepID=UPI001A964FFA|nr:nucleotidyltransferase family protein [Herbiconiux sp. SYSU D00978]